MWLLLMVLLLPSCKTTNQASAKLIHAEEAHQDGPGVVAIEVSDIYDTVLWRGNGVIVGPKTVLTCGHVLLDNDIDTSDLVLTMKGAVHSPPIAVNFNDEHVAIYAPFKEAFAADPDNLESVQNIDLGVITLPASMSFDSRDITAFADHGAAVGDELMLVATGYPVAVDSMSSAGSGSVVKLSGSDTVKNFESDLTIDLTAANSPFCHQTCALQGDSGGAALSRDKKTLLGLIQGGGVWPLERHSLILNLHALPAAATAFLREHGIAFAPLGYTGTSPNLPQPRARPVVDAEASDADPAAADTADGSAQDQGPSVHHESKGNSKGGAR